MPQQPLPGSWLSYPPSRPLYDGLQLLQHATQSATGVSPRHRQSFQGIESNNCGRYNHSFSRICCHTVCNHCLSLVSSCRHGVGLQESSREFNASSKHSRKSEAPPHLSVKPISSIEQ